jgi:hypothetical protein
MRKLLLILSAGLFALGCEEPRQVSVPVDDSIKMEFDNGAETRTMTIDLSSDVWRAEKEDPSADWFSVTRVRGNNDIEVKVQANPGSERRSTVRLNSMGDILARITVIQSPVDYAIYYGDGEVVQLQHATRGSGIDLVIMGEGYVQADMVRDGDGKYEKVAREAVEGFFSVYPYTEYRQYFNVWMVGAVSYDEGMSIEYTNRRVDTRFECVWAGGNSTQITANQDRIFEYARLVSDKTGKGINSLTVIMPINMDVWAGTCLMAKEGFSCSMVPVGEKFHTVVTHETGGHGFAKLCDEYYTQYHPNETLPAELRNEVTEWKNAGHFANLDLHGDIAQTTWAGFAGKPGYDMVATFEGGYMYGRGVWRPERNSCMNDNVLYFNAPSRYAQVKRVMELSGEDTLYTLEDFIRDDKRPPYPTRTRGVDAERQIPLGHPVFVSIPM